MSSSLQVHLFGSLEISCNGRPLPKPATVKSQSLLAYLILHRKTPQRRDVLCNLFWGDRPESKARGSLSTALWQIHRCLPQGEFLLTDSETVQFNPNVRLWMDVDEFISNIKLDDMDSLSSGIALYGGELLAGFEDDWVIDERYHLESAYCSALAKLMEIQERCGNYEAALTTGRRLLEQDPLREDAHRLVMRVYCQLGQRNAALSQYKVCREILQRELGVEPMKETTQLYQSISEEYFPVRPVQDSIPAESSSQMKLVSQGRSPLDTAVLSRMVGRDKELATLQDLWKQALTGSGQLVFLTGEAGVGKTRLVEEFSSSLQWQGYRVLWGRCYEFERLLPYQPIAEALRTIMPPFSEEHSGLPEAEWRMIHHLIPENLEEDEKLSAGPILFDQIRLFGGITQFLSELSAHGAILLVLEDLHWASESTLELLHYLACHLSDRPVMTVGTFRIEEVNPDNILSKMETQLRRDGILQKINLLALSAEHVKDMLKDMSGGGDEIAGLARRLYRDTEGNPFFLVETIKVLFDEGIIQLQQGKWNLDHRGIANQYLPLPASIHDAILNRLQALQPDARDVLYLAAILGREFDFDVLENVYDRGREAALEAVDFLLRQRWIEDGKGLSSRDYVFIHHKMQEVVYSTIPRRRREHLHAQAAMALEKLNPRRHDLVLDEIAYHYEQCHSLDETWSKRAVHFLLLAGDRARDVSAFQDAAGFYERALTILKEGKDHEQMARILIKLGQTRHNALDFRRSRQAYDEAFKSWRQARKGSVPSPSPAPHALRLQWREPETLDPALNLTEWSRTIVGNLFSGLTSLSGEGDIVPEMAFAWQILDSGRQYLFYLREEATWNDGVPVTAEDFIYAWRRILSPAVKSPFASMLFCIRNAEKFNRGEISDPDLIGIQAIDRKTLKVELEIPDGFFLHLLPDFFPVPRRAVELHGESWAQPENIISNGPFLLTNWTHQQGMSLTRNPYYAGSFPGNVEEVQLCLLPDLLTQYRLYEAGCLDMLDFWTIPPAERQAARYKHTNEYLSLPQLGTVYLCLDTRCPPLDDVYVRKALAFAIDKESLADVYMLGDVAPAIGGFLPAGMPAHSLEINIPFDPEQAQSLLSHSSYSQKSVRAFPTIRGLLPRGTLAGLTDLLSWQWKEVLGIEIDWEIAETNRSLGSEPALSVHGAGSEYPNPDHFFRWSNFQVHSHWQNKTFQALLDEARQATDFGRQTDLYCQADQLLMQQVPIIPLTYGRNLMLIKPWVKQYPVSPLFYWPWKEIIIDPH